MRISSFVCCLFWMTLSRRAHRGPRQGGLAGAVLTGDGPGGALVM